jgi:threonine dehydrogenase-like Zn-dependent dehydrogenase
MRGVRSTGDGIEVVTVAPPPDAGVRVRVVSSGICGSDLHVAGFGPSAVTLGHEVGGLLDDGRAVAVLPFVACGTCPRCREGDPQQCADALGAMYGITRDGGMADEVWVDPSCAVPLPGGADPALACLVEPLAVAVHGAHRAGVGPGVSVLVVGAGPIGLCAVAAARHLGADVDLVANRTRRQRAGEALGARLAEVGGYDVVLDAAGTQGSLDRAVRQVRPGGTVGLLGTNWAPVEIGLGLQMKEVTLRPSFAYGHHHDRSEFAEAAAWLADHPGLGEVLITHRYPLEDAAEAFRVAGDREEDAIKVVLEP